MAERVVGKKFDLGQTFHEIQSSVSLASKTCPTNDHGGRTGSTVAVAAHFRIGPCRSGIKEENGDVARRRYFTTLSPSADRLKSKTLGVIPK